SGPEPRPSRLPVQTTTVTAGVTAAHHASRLSLLVPVFHATDLLAASWQMFAVRSGSASACRTCQQVRGEKQVFPSRVTPPRPIVAYACAISVTLASAPPIASDRP